MAIPNRRTVMQPIRRTARSTSGNRVRIARSARACGLLIVMALCAARAGTTGSDRIVTVRVQGTELQVELASGTVLAGKDLAGATLSLAGPDANTPARVRIDEVIEDPRDPRHEILLYHMSAIDSATGAASELCNPDAHGDRWAFPLQGQWTPDGE